MSSSGQARELKGEPFNSDKHLPYDNYGAVRGLVIGPLGKRPNVRPIEPQDDGPFSDLAGRDRQSARPDPQILAAWRWTAVGGADRVHAGATPGRRFPDFRILHAAGRGAIRFDHAGALLVP